MLAFQAGGDIIKFMNKGMVKNAVLILLIGITVFSMARYMSELKERYRLKESLTQAQGRITVLVQEKQNLLQEQEKEKKLKEQLALKNTNLKNYLRASKNKITCLFQDNAKTQASLEEVSVKLSILKAENRALIDNRKRVYLENKQFKLKLSSIIELKKAIRELKANKHKDSGAEKEGNRGFLIKNGQPTTAEKVIIEVIPAKTKE